MSLWRGEGENRDELRPLNIRYYFVQACPPTPGTKFLSHPLKKENNSPWL